jgi:hypothetical protein
MFVNQVYDSWAAFFHDHGRDPRVLAWNQFWLCSVRNHYNCGCVQCGSDELLPRLDCKSAYTFLASPVEKCVTIFLTVGHSSCQMDQAHKKSVESAIRQRDAAEQS